MEADYLLIGRGLAGSTLALKLVQRGCRIVSIDEPYLSTSSRVAAGLINPLVFKRLTFTWRAQESIQAAAEFYTGIQEQTNKDFYRSDGMLRLFGTEFEAKTWEKLRLTPEYEPHLAEPIQLSADINLNVPFGAAMIKTAGSIDTEKYLDTVYQLISSDSLSTVLTETFEQNHISFSNGRVQYKDYTAKALILCEGWKAVQSKWFSWLPFKPAKGEILTIRANKLSTVAFSGGVFGLPLTDNLFRIGSTYEWDFTDDQPTAEQRSALSARLADVTNSAFEIIDHQAGVRPTVIDRRPIAGKHPCNENLFIFNGLGTHGVLLVPLLADEMTEFILNNKPISSEYSIDRFRQYESAKQ